MRISDWSSDVCSSDLSEHAVAKIRDAIPRVKTQAPVAAIGAEQIEDAAAKRIIHVDAFTVTTQARLGDTQTSREKRNPATPDRQGQPARGFGAVFLPAVEIGRASFGDSLCQVV